MGAVGWLCVMAEPVHPADRAARLHLRHLLHGQGTYNYNSSPYPTLPKEETLCNHWSFMGADVFSHLSSQVGRKRLQLFGFAGEAFIFGIMAIFLVRPSHASHRLLYPSQRSFSLWELVDCVRHSCAILTSVSPPLFPVLQAKIKMFNGLFICLYALTFFFDDFGPNLTTFGSSLPPLLSHWPQIVANCCTSSEAHNSHADPSFTSILCVAVIPATIYPTEVRSTCHGISAAFGKVRPTPLTDFSPFPWSLIFLRPLLAPRL